MPRMFQSTFLKFPKKAFWIYIQVRCLISGQIKFFFQIFTIVTLVYLYCLEISALKILQTFLKLILKTKQTSFLGQHLVKMSLSWLMRAFQNINVLNFAFLQYPTIAQNFSKIPLRGFLEQSELIFWDKIGVLYPILS